MYCQKHITQAEPPWSLMWFSAFLSTSHATHADISRGYTGPTPAKELTGILPQSNGFLTWPQSKTKNMKAKTLHCKLFLKWELSEWNTERNKLVGLNRWIQRSVLHWTCEFIFLLRKCKILAHGRLWYETTLGVLLSMKILLFIGRKHFFPFMFNDIFDIYQ